ncbi:MAG: hypothetical protein M3Z75_00340 [Actinomycetota bacterium]|nr:hypothetical protein [Actinomycetota bacterium]
MRTRRDARRRRPRVTGLPPESGRPTTWVRVIAAASSAALLGTLGLAGTSMAATGDAANATTHAAKAGLTASTSSCHLGHGVKHVVELTFDNVHYFRDNPNVPSDLQMMPSLLNFFERNGTFLANNHTPLIAHTADDLLTTFTGLYGDRQGMPISNGFQAYNTNGTNGTFGTTDPAGSFAYWTDPVNDTASKPSPGHDTNPNLVYAPVPPATAAHPVAPSTDTPAPWVPFTRAGCDVGDVATVNQELENTTPDIADAFGVSSPEAQQLAADTDSFKDAETADYVGLAVHCARGNTFCSTAKAVKYGQSAPSPTAVADSLPTEPGGYTGFQALFGHKYVAPQLGAGTASLTRHGVQVTNAAGNLVDENGNQINGAFLTNRPGFPGFGPINASQTLAYLSDLLESNVPVVNGYIADIHGNEHIPGLAACQGAPSALGSGTACYVAQARYYNAAFGVFFKRLAADGITTANTLFVLSSDEGDHQAAANVGRAIQPTPANCNGVTVACTYPAGSFGELAGNITGLLATQKHDTTPFTLENDSAPEFYVTGDPSPVAAPVRTLERDVSQLTATNPYAGGTQKIANYLADPAEEAILHMVNADPARTPTFALFAKPDYYLTAGSATCSGSCVTVNSGFGWNHGDYAAEINTNYAAFAGPGVRPRGLDGLPAADGPSSAGPDSGQVVVVQSGTTGTWTDETDIRPTLMYLTGLKDDYEHDGRVITQILAAPDHALRGRGVATLGACYKQLNSSVGQFGNDTLQASTAAVESSTAGDREFTTVNAALTGLDRVRDALALRIKGELEAAAFADRPVFDAYGQTVACRAVIAAAGVLAHHL